MNPALLLRVHLSIETNVRIDIQARLGSELGRGRSLLWGAARGWTTLTANKTSIKAILKEMKSARSGVLWDRSDMVGECGGGVPGPGGHETAAIWMVDPRSLAEGMRADFGTQ